MHTLEAVDALVIALGDTNRAVRYEAVIGLAELTGQNQWAPAIETFEREEQRYLDHWKEWSRTSDWTRQMYDLADAFLSADLMN